MQKRIVVVRSLGEGNSQMLMKRYRVLVIQDKYVPETLGHGDSIKNYDLKFTWRVDHKYSYLTHR